MAVWLYFRFTTSLRDVEEMLAERGIDATYETVRCWANKFGPAIAANIRRMRKPDPYKQKGVRYTGEVLKKKAGKTGAK